MYNKLFQKIKIEKASTFNLKESHKNTRLFHSFSIFLKKQKLQACGLDWGGCLQNCPQIATRLKSLILSPSLKVRAQFESQKFITLQNDQSAGQNYQ